MVTYKKDQGRLARMAAFWVLAILVFYGCTSLRALLSGLSEQLSVPIGGATILGFDLSPAALISMLVLGTSLWLLYRWQNKPKTADLLIETETELRKVTWPTLDETIKGSVTVMVCVLILMAYLAGADWLLARWAKLVLLGRS